MEDDLEWLSVGCEHDQVGHTLVQGLCCLVGSLLQLYHLTERLATANRREMQNHIAINSIIRKVVLNIRWWNSAEGNLQREITHAFRDSVVDRDVNIILVCIERRS